MPAPKRYRVRAYWLHVVEVEAESEDEARDNALSSPHWEQDESEELDTRGFRVELLRED